MKVTIKKDRLFLIIFFVLLILISCCLAIGIFGVIGKYEPRSVNGNSMLPTLVNGELIITERWLSNVSPGDIVIYEESGTDLIHRIVAIEGDVISFADGYLFVNGKLESYSNFTVTSTPLPINSTFIEGEAYNVPEGYVLLLGDNRSGATRDSRFTGFISLDKIKARYLFSYYKPNAN